MLKFSSKEQSDLRSIAMLSGSRADFERSIKEYYNQDVPMASVASSIGTSHKGEDSMNKVAKLMEAYGIGQPAAEELAKSVPEEQIPAGTGVGAVSLSKPLEEKPKSPVLAPTLRERVSSLIDSFTKEFREYRDLRNLTTQWNAHSDAKGFSDEIRQLGAEEFQKRGFICEARKNEVLASVPTYGEQVAVDGVMVPRETLEPKMASKVEENLFDEGQGLV